MSLRDDYLEANGGHSDQAAAALARDLHRGDPADFKAGYSQENALLAAVEMFPTVPPSVAADINGWTVPEWAQ